MNKKKTIPNLVETNKNKHYEKVIENENFHPSCVSCNLLLV
jgi:hypothetical protein